MATATDDHHEVHDSTLPGSPSRDPTNLAAVATEKVGTEDCAAVDVDGVAAGARARLGLRPVAPGPRRGRAAGVVRAAEPRPAPRRCWSGSPCPTMTSRPCSRCGPSPIATSSCGGCSSAATRASSPSMGDGDAFIDCPSLPRELDLQGPLLLGVRLRGDGRRRPARSTSSAACPTTSPGRRSPIWASRWSSTGSAVARRASTSSGGSSRTSSGALYALGRLQFHLYHLRVGIAGPAFWPETDEPGFRKGDATLGVHIPAIGPLAPSECDASFDLARSFVERHFPEHDFHGARPARRGCSTSSSPTTCPPTRTSCGSNAASPSSTARPTMDATPCASCSIACRSRSTSCRSARRSSGRSCSHLRGGGRWKTRTGWLDLRLSRIGDGLGVRQVDVAARSRHRVPATRALRRCRRPGTAAAAARRGGRAPPSPASGARPDSTRNCASEPWCGSPSTFGRAGEGDHGHVGTEVAEDARPVARARR